MQPRKRLDAASLAERRRQSHTLSKGSPWTRDEANASSDEGHLHRQLKEDQHVASSFSSAKGGGDQMKGKGDDYEKGKGDDDGKGTGYDDEMKGKGNAEKSKGNDETYTTPWQSNRSRNAAAHQTAR